MSTASAEKRDTKNENAVTPRTCACVMTPPVDIFETETELTIELDLPGMSLQAIDVQIEQSALRVCATREGDEHRGAIQYERAFRIGHTLDEGAIAATYNDGVLALRLPKCEAARQRRIEVQAG